MPWFLLFVALMVTICTATYISEQNASRMEDDYVAIRSPNYNSRPFFGTVDCVVLHATVTETADDAIRIFLARGSKVSAHFVVARDGKVTQMVPVGKRAWHGGTSRLGRRANVNDFSVGIEMVNRNDGLQPYTDRQYEAVAGIIRDLRTNRQYSIPPERIVSHRAIALPQGRKSDPRGFDFSRLHRLLAER
ncbi:MAG: N-acetylmuramoyl-L-alanine amidase [Fibrella sp.]|nr:N-acetylmuramoyl-L-alanine amidase [Armatimonadota bacterium]